MDFKSVLEIIQEKIRESEIKDLESVKENVKTEPVRPKRCQHDGCKVKLMLADFACRCSGFYCSSHRFSEAHKCSFDYKSQGLNTLAKEMQAVIGKKVDKL
jgi:predicted nucleic acid binding AN1-type Zn finger protein